MHDIFSEFDDCELGEILVSYSRCLDEEKFSGSRLYIQKLINHIMEERNVSDIDIYRGLFIFNFNFDKMTGVNPMTMFNRYLLKRYFLSGGDKEIVDNLNCSSFEKEVLRGVEKDGRMGFVLSLFVQPDKRDKINLEIEVPKIYTMGGLVMTDFQSEIFVTKSY